MSQQQLEPLPPPGLAIFPEFLSANPVTLNFRGDFFTTGAEIQLNDESWLTIEQRGTFSLSRKKHFIHVASNSLICSFHRETSFSRGVEYLALNDREEVLFSVHYRPSLTSGGKWDVEFANVAAAAGGPAEMQMLEARTSMFGQDTELCWNGRLVALVEAGFFSGGRKSTLYVAPGMDPFVVVGLVVAIVDHRRSQR